MKAFFKPSPPKIILAFALFIVASYLWRIVVISRISDTFPWGFPLQFYLSWGPCPRGEVCSEFNGLWLFLDLVIWFIVSAFIIYYASKRKWKNELSAK